MSFFPLFIKSIRFFTPGPSVTCFSLWHHILTCFCCYLVAKLCPTLGPRGPPGSSVHGVLQVRILEWVVSSFSRRSSQPGIKPLSLALAGRFLTTETPRNALCYHAKSLRSCSSLCDPMGCSPPGSSVHVIFQARILQWVATSSFRGMPLPFRNVKLTKLNSLREGGGRGDQDGEYM